ncbi:MAG: hypothetical protein DHS20C01_11350 [marine bacterium B5-7]|nr:MAG: hypothetical protein DHS20C01_11350 [marine bacterium B5-7]
MADSMNDIMHPGSVHDEQFPNAPQNWVRADAERIASREGIELTDDHLEVIRALQKLMVNNQDPAIRQIHDALEEHFHSKGGVRYLYKLLPEGPVAQGCRLAGLKAPPGSTSASFGSVQ